MLKFGTLRFTGEETRDTSGYLQSFARGDELKACAFRPQILRCPVKNDCIFSTALKEFTSATNKIRQGG